MTRRGAGNDRRCWWFLRLIVMSVTVFGKNSTNTGAGISHSGPIPSEGREEIFIGDPLCARH